MLVSLFCGFKHLAIWHILNRGMSKRLGSHMEDISMQQQKLKFRIFADLTSCRSYVEEPTGMVVTRC